MKSSGLDTIALFYVQCIFNISGYRSPALYMCIYAGLVLNGIPILDLAKQHDDRIQIEGSVFLVSTSNDWYDFVCVVCCFPLLILIFYHLCVKIKNL